MLRSALIFSVVMKSFIKLSVNILIDMAPFFISYQCCGTFCVVTDTMTKYAKHYHTCLMFVCKVRVTHTIKLLQPYLIRWNSRLLFSPMSVTSTPPLSIYLRSKIL